MSKRTNAGMFSATRQPARRGAATPNAGQFGAARKATKPEPPARCWCADAGPEACPVHAPGMVALIVGDLCVAVVEAGAQYRQLRRAGEAGDTQIKGTRAHGREG